MGFNYPKTRDDSDCSRYYHPTLDKEYTSSTELCYQRLTLLNALYRTSGTQRRSSSLKSDRSAGVCSHAIAAVTGAQFRRTSMLHRRIRFGPSRVGLKVRFTDRFFLIHCDRKPSDWNKSH
ncbi:uncharacterized protein LOC112589380 [Harpegnathos saltator]|uniref:uncharacterized protein LOC112589380 n=1 Tax=Harpegnathos saltator TaxID=610380 RepID=UPI000DBEDD8B|nr:uncharacterized protein LOC112589380 [Harpegnathos saltator]